MWSSSSLLLAKTIAFVQTSFLSLSISSSPTIEWNSIRFYYSSSSSSIHNHSNLQQRRDYNSCCSHIPTGYVWTLHILTLNPFAFEIYLWDFFSVCANSWRRGGAFLWNWELHLKLLFKFFIAYLKLFISSARDSFKSFEFSSSWTTSKWNRRVFSVPCCLPPVQSQNSLRTHQFFNFHDLKFFDFLHSYNFVCRPLG